MAATRRMFTHERRVLCLWCNTGCHFMMAWCLVLYLAYWPPYWETFQPVLRL